MPYTDTGVDYFTDVKYTTFIKDREGTMLGSAFAYTTHGI
jgi:hypothetical protein